MVSRHSHETDEMPAEYDGGGRAANAEEFPDGDDVSPTDAPNPEERRTNRIRLGPEVIAVASWVDDAAVAGKLSFETMDIGEAPVDEWVTLRGIVAFLPLASASTAAPLDAARAPNVSVHVEVTERGYAVEARNLRAVSPTSVTPSEALEYVPCQIDPAAAPDAVYAFAPEADAEDGGDGDGFDVDIKLCSRGYSQTLTVYEDGVPVRTAAAPPAAKVSSRSVILPE